MNNIVVFNYNSITECSQDLNVSRTTINKYLDTNTVYLNKYVFSSTPLNHALLDSLFIPLKTWEIVTGELLGDGHIRYNPEYPNINGRLEFTFSSDILHYVEYLKFNALSYICTKSNPTPWVNNIKNEITQYWFSTMRMPYISNLHSDWYVKIGDKYVKKLPNNIEELLTPLAIAHWLMGDGYYSTSVLICTDNFTKDEVLILTGILENKFDIKANLRERKLKDRTVWRIYIKKSSLERLKELVVPYMIPEMLYKLGIKQS